MEISVDRVAAGTVPLYDFDLSRKVYVSSGEPKEAILVTPEHNKRALVPLYPISEDFISSMKDMMGLGDRGIMVIDSDDRVGFIAFG